MSSEMKRLVDEYRAEAEQHRAVSNQLSGFLTALVLRHMDDKHEVRISRADMEKTKNEGIQIVMFKSFVKLVHVVDKKE